MLQAKNDIGLFIRMPKHTQYFMHLHIERNVHNLCYIVKGKPLIYGIRCVVTNMVYIGSSLVPHDRFYAHLVTGNNSNSNLQQAIAKYGLNKFTVLVFEFVTLPRDQSFEQKVNNLKAIEQSYIDKFPKAQLYNSINAQV